jgi:ribosomal protein L7Ae-like RNA K-turn-binding protein
MNPNKIRQNEPYTGVYASSLAVYRMIGLATRAGRTVTGTEAGLKTIDRDKAWLVILAEDTAENTREQIQRAADRKQVTIAEFGSKEELGRWTGHPERAIVVLTDQGFAARIIELMGTWKTSFHEGQLEEKG